ncbi:MAG: FAD-dependent oxidoreductase [Tenacibaculum sp.]|nr:FAD-dependent oxidoreductase [Tenacibaculum sp.]
MEIDYIIVGLGLAGLSFSEKLLDENKTFVVFEDNSYKSSFVAGGVYNPVILKRFTPVWNAYEQLQRSKPFYKKLEDKFSEKFDTKIETKKVFTSIGDENNWFAACDKPVLSRYMKPEIFKGDIKGVNANFGFGEVTGTGWVDTKKLLPTYRKYLKGINKLIEERFDYNLLKIEENSVKYKDIIAKKVVFCEGFGLHKNPFFNNLPLDGAKGETITIKSAELNINFLLKSGIFVLPLGNDTYKVGATFNWLDKTAKPTKEGREELEEKLKKTINVPYEVIEQEAEVRPTVKDRRPLVGKHPKYQNLAILNGLGTRGVMLAPTLSEQLYNHLENDEELDKEININRIK